MVKIFAQEPPKPIYFPVKTRTPGQNVLCTSHYHAWSFVFVNLFEQFHRAANVFFLFTAILQAIPVISSLNHAMGFVSLCFMLAISMVKVGFEDFRRHIEDDEVNTQKVSLWTKEPINIKRGEKSRTTIIEWVRKKLKKKDPNTIREELINHEFDGGHLTDVLWRDVQPGDVLYIRCDEQFPADCVILSASSHDGRCRIETAALDGESDLKYRHNVADQLDLKQGSFLVEMSPPITDLGNFNGCITASDGEKYFLGLSNFVARGCTLRKTESVYALAIYTGPETKIIMNSAKPRYKYTEIDKFLSKFVIVLFVILLILSVVLTVCSYFWGKSNIKNGYLGLQEMPDIYYFWTVFSWILILNYFIPLSLYSSLDLVRFFLSFMITYDVGLRDADGKKSVCRNSDLLSTIGRITHIFSDKTGTLTKNIMTFKVAGFHDVVLGFPSDEDSSIEEVHIEDSDLKESKKSSDEEKSDSSSFTEKSENLAQKALNSERLLSFSQQDINYIKQNINTNQDIKNFLYTIVLCNTVSTSVNNNFYTNEEIQKQFPDFKFTYDLPPPEVVAAFPYSITYLTGSPDELCLVHLARECGWILYNVVQNKVQVLIDGKLVEFERPISFDFTSKRRRGSVIVKLPDDGKYYMLMKGADSILSELAHPDPLFEYVQDVSSIGLRTLVYAKKEIENPDDIIQRYIQAKMMPSGGELLLEKLSNEVETGLDVIGISGVEDELQDEVGLTLKRLRMANIKVWMLTGDKLSTALNIGKTTELISPLDDVITISFVDCENNFESLNIKNPLRTVLALEGSTFAAFVNQTNISKKFFEISSQCSAIIIARCEPSQKGNVVRHFKSFNKKNTLLAIGDGANDVDMIRAADVGVGVEGKEGSEAVMSSDFSIPSFHHLASLLIVHGRWCVNRVSLLILLTFYKNAMIGILQIYYGIFNGFSATSTFDSAFLTCYNLLLTIPQLFFICVFEQDLSASYVLAVPHIYKECQKSGGLAAHNIAEFYILSIFHSAMIFFFSYFESNTVTTSSDGRTFDYAIFTQITGWSILFVFTVTLLTRFKTFTMIHILLYIICIFIYIFIEFIYSFFDIMFYDIVSILFSMPRIWFTLPFCVGSCIVIDLLLINIKSQFYPSLSNAVAELEYAACYGKLNFSL